MKLRNLRKPLIWTAGIIVVIVIVIIIFISPLTKYLVEKYDEPILGRKIEMDLAYTNPFTGYVYFDNVRVYEANGDSLFFSADGLSANITMSKLLAGTYEISELRLTRPVVTFIQNDSVMNLDDIIDRFTPKKDSVPDSPDKKETRFSILSIVFVDGQVNYREEVIPVSYSFKNVNLESTGYRWDADTIRTEYSFEPSSHQGKAKGYATINIKNQDYRLASVIAKYDLKFIEQYVKDLTQYGRFDANLDADIYASGNLKDAEKLDARGMLGINAFRFGKHTGEDYASFDKLVLDITHLNPAKHLYIFDSAILSKPFFKYERYDHFDNFSTMFGKGGQNVTAAAADPSSSNIIFQIADYVAKLSKNFFKSDYKVNKIAISDANFQYNDYALNEKFTIATDPLNLYADSIAKSKDRVKLSLRSGLKPYGKFSVFVSINPKDSSDFDMTYEIDRVPMAMFNPYLITYTSFPMDRGRIDISGKWHVRNGHIQSENHLLIVDPRIAKRIKKKDAKRLPLPLIMYFVRERANVIDYEIPVTGDLNDPKFHLRDVVFDILTNMFIKPPTIPYRIKVKLVENEIEKLLYLKWGMRQTEMLKEQERFMDKIADYLRDNSDATIIVQPRPFEDKEKEYILLYLAKKKYFMHVNEITEASYTMEDSLKVEYMSMRDSFFTKFLRKNVKSNERLFTIQDQCMAYVGKQAVNAAYAKLMKARENVFMGYFRARGVHRQVKLIGSINKIPYNGFSLFSIEYKGELPHNLHKAYNEMNDLDNSPPRSRFKQERRRRYRKDAGL